MVFQSLLFHVERLWLLTGVFHVEPLAMATILAVANQKGGVGKTTTVVNVAAFAALAGQRVLVVDNDPQGNASSVLAPDVEGPSIYGGAKPVSTAHSNLSCIVAGNDLLDREQVLAQSHDGRRALSSLLVQHQPHFDLILIDSPPNLTVLPTNALLAADYLLIPLQSEYFALEGLSQLLAYVDQLRITAQLQLRLAGILVTMFDPDIIMSHQVLAEIGKHFPNHIAPVPIPRDTSLAAAPSHSATITTYDPLCAGALAYLEATRWLLSLIKPS
ncbi:chromosome partitioning protein [Planctomycetota bacterium]|nr:chromosome partitioning protein [Planctomycetota bacterium]